MEPIELTFAQKPRQGENCQLQMDAEELVLCDSDQDVITRFHAGEAVMRLHAPSFWASRYIVIDGERGETLCFEPRPKAVRRVRELLDTCLNQHPGAAAAAMRRKGVRDLLIGGVSLVLGLVITLISFGATQPDGKYTIMTGLLGVGVVEVIRGIYWFAQAGQHESAVQSR